MNTYLQKSSAILMGLLMIFGAVLTPQSEVFAQVSETLEEDIVIEEILINEIHDVQPPEFSPVSNVVREATSSSGTIVSYPLPTALDENQVVSTTCSPESGSQFPLGQTQVICTATDNSNNESQTTFAVSVVDTTAPSFDSIINIEVVAMQVSAMKPMGLNEESIDPKVLDDEKDIILKQIENTPDDKKEQIVKGKLNKFIKENTLMGQALITDPKNTVSNYISNLSKTNNLELNISSMDLYTI